MRSRWGFHSCYTTTRCPSTNLNTQLRRSFLPLSFTEFKTSRSRFMRSHSNKFRLTNILQTDNRTHSGDLLLLKTNMISTRTNRQPCSPVCSTPTPLRIPFRWTLISFLHLNKQQTCTSRRSTTTTTVRHTYPSTKIITIRCACKTTKLSRRRTTKRVRRWVCANTAVNGLAVIFSSNNPRNYIISSSRCDNK